MIRNHLQFRLIRRPVSDAALDQCALFPDDFIP